MWCVVAERLRAPDSSSSVAQRQSVGLSLHRAAKHKNEISASKTGLPTVLFQCGFQDERTTAEY